MLLSTLTVNSTTRNSSSKPSRMFRGRSSRFRFHGLPPPAVKLHSALPYSSASSPVEVFTCGGTAPLNSMIHK